MPLYRVRPAQPRSSSRREFSSRIGAVDALYQHRQHFRQTLDFFQQQSWFLGWRIALLHPSVARQALTKFMDTLLRIRWKVLWISLQFNWNNTGALPESAR